MWKQSLMALMVACSLTACKGGGGVDDAVNWVKSLANLVKGGNSSKEKPIEPYEVAQVAAPKGLKIVPPQYAPEILNATAQSYRLPIQYTPNPPEEAEPTVYFDKTGKAVPELPPDGYSRQFLGKIPDGRDLVQDFYANGNPQTSPFVLRAGGDKQSFDATMVEGLLLNFAVDGSLKAVSEYRGGKMYGVQSYYQNKQLIAQAFNGDGKEMLWLLYPNGVVQMQVNNTTNESIFFREDGTAHAQFSYKDNKLRISIWQPNGMSVPKGEEFDKMFTELQPLVQDLQDRVKLLD